MKSHYHMRDSAPKHYDWEHLTDDRPDLITNGCIIFAVSVVLGYLLSMLIGWICTPDWWQESK